MGEQVLADGRPPLDVEIQGQQARHLGLGICASRQDTVLQSLRDGADARRDVRAGVGVVRLEQKLATGKDEFQRVDAHPAIFERDDELAAPEFVVP